MANLHFSCLRFRQYFETIPWLMTRSSCSLLFLAVMNVYANSERVFGRRPGKLEIPPIIECTFCKERVPKVEHNLKRNPNPQQLKRLLKIYAAEHWRKFQSSCPNGKSLLQSCLENCQTSSVEVSQWRLVEANLMISFFVKVLGWRNILGGVSFSYLFITLDILLKGPSDWFWA